jgi:hypothetical protein
VELLNRKDAETQSRQDSAWSAIRRASADNPESACAGWDTYTDGANQTMLIVRYASFPNPLELLPSWLAFGLRTKCKNRGHRLSFHAQAWAALQQHC